MFRGLPDEELADPDELERQVVQEEWGPVLMLPEKRRRWSIQPNIDESGGVDWGAFGTVDFERGRPAFDKVRYKMDWLREKLEDVLIMLGIVKERLPGKAKYLVLKYLRMGIIELEHVVNDDMLALVRLYKRAEQLRQEIAGARGGSPAKAATGLGEVFGLSRFAGVLSEPAQYASGFVRCS